MLLFTVIIIDRDKGNGIIFIKVHLRLKYEKTGYSFLLKKIEFPVNFFLKFQDNVVQFCRSNAILSFTVTELFDFTEKIFLSLTNKLFK